MHQEGKKKKNAENADVGEIICIQTAPKRINKNTSIYRNSVYMKDRENIVNNNPKKHVMKLG